MNHGPKERLDFREVTEAATGRWDEIYSRIAANQLGPALDRPGKKVDCPFPDHGGKKDFRLYKDFAHNGAGVCTCCHTRHGFELLQKLYGWDIKTAMEEVARALWGEARLIETDAAPPKPKHNHRRNQFLTQEMNRIWEETIPLSDDDAQVATAYFNRRGIYWRALDGLDNTLRFHPSLEFLDDDEIIGNWPAIIAMVTAPDNSRVTIHRIYLDQASLYTGKAKAKMMFPIPDTVSLEGASIKFGEATPVLASTEGIETALAVREATGLTVWPCYCDWMQGQFIPPAGTQTLLQFGDRDPSKAGEIACQKGEQRLSERMQVHSLIPGRPGDKMDWNDVLMTQGRYGFRPVLDFISQCYNT